jgi:hypothetical protein
MQTVAGDPTGIGPAGGAKASRQQTGVREPPTTMTALQGGVREPPH